MLCTGNAARSVMAGFMFDVLRDGRPGAPLHVVTDITVLDQPLASLRELETSLFGDNGAASTLRKGAWLACWFVYTGPTAALVSATIWETIQSP